MRIIRILILFLFIPTVLFAQDDEEVVNLGDEFIKGRNAYLKRDYIQTIDILAPVYGEIKKVYTDTAQFIYLNDILGDAYFQMKQPEKAILYYTYADSVCSVSEKIFTKNSKSCIFSALGIVDYYDLKNQESKSLPLILKVFNRYRSNQIPKDDNYYLILQRLTNFYLAVEDTKSLIQHLNMYVVPDRDNYCKDLCKRFDVLDPVLLYLEKNKEYALAQSLLIPDSIGISNCTAGFLYHKYTCSVGLNKIAAADNYLSNSFSTYIRYANDSNHGPYLYLLQAQKRWELNDLDSVEVLLNTIKAKNWVKDLSAKRVYHLLWAAVEVNDNNWTDAITNYQQALNNTGSGDEGRIAIYSEMAVYYDKKGDYISADTFYNKVLTDPTFKLSTSAFSGRFYSNYASHFQQMGKWKEADNAFYNAFKFLSKVSEGSEQVYENTLNNLAVFYLSIGKFEDALKIYNQLLSKKINAKNSDYVFILENKAGVLVQFNRLEEAVKTYDEAIQLAAALKMKYDYLLDLKANKSFLLIKQHKFSEAEQQFQVIADELKVSQNTSLLYSKVLSNLAEAQEHNEKYEQAFQNYKQSLSIRERILGRSHPDLAIIHSKLARVSWVKKDWANADLYWSNTLQNYKSQIKYIFSILTEKERIDFYNTFKNQFEQLNSYALIRGQQKQSWFDTMYVYQGMLQGLLFKTDQRLKKLVVESKSKDVGSLYANLTATRQHIADHFNGNTYGNIDSLIKQLNRFEKELTVLVGSWQTDVDVASPQLIRDQLEQNESVVQLLRFKKYRPDKAGTYVEFSIGTSVYDSTYYIALILKKGQNEIEYEVFRNGAFMDKKYINYYLNSIKFDLKDTLSYNSFWFAIDQHLQNTSKLYLIPDGVYNLINPITLKNHSGEYVLDKYRIIRLSSINELLLNNIHDARLSKAVLIGNPLFTSMNLHGNEITPDSLPGTKTEIRAIQKDLMDKEMKVVLFEDTAATEKTIRVNAEQSTILHFATHGYFLDIPEARDEEFEMSHPLFRSGLLLSYKKSGFNSSDDDGVLSAYEVSLLNMSNTKLVVLSACESGLGLIKNGEGVYGLQRAFRTAGANSVIMSLWKIDDEATAFFMNAFYLKYSTDLNASEALYYAENQTRIKYSSPSYWGAFCIIGK